MLLLDGVYADQPDGAWRFHWVKEPSRAELARLSHTLAERIARYLEQQDLLEREAQNSYLAGDMIESGAIEQLQGAGTQARIHHLPYCNWSTARAQSVHSADATGK
ncbi:MAG: hypothetical protein HKN43_13280 [Rhodothermales bacterium]|nr:hypothetical protein [Rhodothermales bacterium]